MDIEDMMPCGNCNVCLEPVDHADTGFCGECGAAFHWHECGGWDGGEHRCGNCQMPDDD